MKTILETLKAATMLERDLRRERPDESVPPELHAAVMRAVRTASCDQARSTRPILWRWAVAAGGVTFVALGMWWSLVPHPDEAMRIGSRNAVQPMMALAWDQGHELTKQAPDAVLAPLLGEMELLNRDLQSAVSLVVASVP